MLSQTMSLLMHSLSSVQVIDSHTAGEPTRMVISGVPDLGTGTLTERLACFREQYDFFRSGVVNEPAGFGCCGGRGFSGTIRPDMRGGGDLFQQCRLFRDVRLRHDRPGADASAHGPDRAFNLQPRATRHILIGSSRQYEDESAAVDHGIVGRMIERVCEYMPEVGKLSA